MSDREVHAFYETSLFRVDSGVYQGLDGVTVHIVVLTDQRSPASPVWLSGDLEASASGDTQYAALGHLEKTLEREHEFLAKSLAEVTAGLVVVREAMEVSKQKTLWSAEES